MASGPAEERRQGAAARGTGRATSPVSPTSRGARGGLRRSEQYPRWIWAPASLPLLLLLAAAVRAGGSVPEPGGPPQPSPAPAPAPAQQPAPPAPPSLELLSPSPAGADAWRARIRRLLSQALFAQSLLRQQPSGAGAAELTQALTALEREIPSLEASVFGPEERAEILSELEESLGRLSSLRPLAQSYRVHLVGHSGAEQDASLPSDTVAALFAHNLRLARDFPGYVFAHGRASDLAYVEARRPELWREVVEAVRAGSFAVTGGQWASFDPNLSGGESQVRQMLLGKRFLRAKLGVDARTGWMPEGFGLSSTLPQILARSGIENLWIGNSGQAQPVFQWQGLDGSRVLTQDGAGGGGAPFTEEVGLQLFQHALLAESRFGARDLVTFVGTAEEGVGPLRSELEAVDQLTHLGLSPSVSYSHPDKAFAALRARGSFPTAHGEIGISLGGLYSSDARVKKASRDAERSLIQAETLSTLASLLGLPYPAADLERAWKLLLANQSPQVLGGAAGPERSAEAQRLLRQSALLARAAADRALQHLGLLVETRGEGTPLLVVNTLAFPRSDPVVVSVPPPRSGSSPRVVDDQGRPCPAQVVRTDEGAATGETQVLFIARDVPAMGYRVYRLTWTDEPFPEETTLEVIGAEATEPGGASPSRRSPLPGLPVIRASNGLYTLTLDRASGSLISLIDHRRGDRELIAEGDAGNRLQVLLEAPHSRSAASMALPRRTLHLDRAARVRVLEAGPARALLEVTYDWPEGLPGSGATRFRQYLALYAGLDRIDLPLELQWHERSAATDEIPTLKLGFALAAPDAAATAEVPFGAVSRPHRGREYPMQRWVDLSGSGLGVSVLNDGRFGYDVLESRLEGKTTVRVSLLRGANDPDPAPDQGEHQVTLALLPHGGDWRKAATVRQALQLNYPLLCLPLERHPGRLPPSRSWLSVEAPNVVVSAVKRAEGSQDLILRLYEAHGAPATIEVKAPNVGPVQETDLLEEAPGQKRTAVMSVESGAGDEAPRLKHRVEVDVRRVVTSPRVSLGPWEIKTLRVDLRQPWMLPFPSFEVPAPGQLPPGGPPVQGTPPRAKAPKPTPTPPARQ